MDVNFTSRGLSVLLASALSLSIPVAAYSQGGHQTKPSSVKGQQGKVFLRGQVVDNTSYNNVTELVDIIHHHYLSTCLTVISDTLRFKTYRNEA